MKDSQQPCLRAALKLVQIAVAAAFLACLSPTARAQATDVDYRQTFGSVTQTGGDLASTLFGWQTFNQDGTLRTAVNINANDGNNPGGWPRDLMNTANAGQIYDSEGYGPTDRGWAYLQTGQPLMISQQFTLTPVPGVTEFSWWQLNPNAARETRLLVQVGGVWYASAAAFTGGVGGIGVWATDSERKSLVYDPAAANWLDIAFDGGFDQASTVAIPLGIPGTPALADLVGDITGFGIWHDQNVTGAGTGNSRFDNFTVVVPEPSSIALLGLGFAALGIGAVRRGRRAGG